MNVRLKGTTPTGDKVKQDAILYPDTTAENFHYANMYVQSSGVPSAPYQVLFYYNIILMK